MAGKFFSNKFFKRLMIISEKEREYFSYNFKNSSCLGKRFLLRKIHKRLNNVPGRPVFSNCGLPTENLSSPSVYYVGRRIVQKNTNDLSEKLKNLGNIPSNTILVTADVAGLYPCIPHDPGLQALYERLEERTEKKIHLLT